jgi:hypothetical protein
LTVQSAGDLIYNYPWAAITWSINLAAGTYSTTGSTFSSPFPSPYRVKFLGPAVSIGTQPTAILQGTGATPENGIYFQNFIRAQVQDINFKRFRNAASPSSSSLSSGVVVDTNCEVYFLNTWVDDSDQGIYVTNRGEARIQGGRFGYNGVNGANVQFIRHSSGTVGYGGSAADINGATGTAMIGGEYGGLLQEFSMAHFDNCYFSAQTLAGILLNTSRCHTVTSTFNACAVGVDGRMNSNIGITSPTFTACTTDTVSRSGTVYAGVSGIAESLYFSPSMMQVQTASQSTQSTTPVAITMPGGGTFVAKEFQTRGMGFVLTLYGSCTGVANTKTVTISVNATVVLTATIAAATTNFKIVVKLVNVTAASSQYVFTEIIQNGVTPTVAFTTTLAENLTNAATVSATFQVTNAADLIKVGMLELSEQH